MRAVYVPTGSRAPVGVDLADAQDFFCLAEIVQTSAQGAPSPAIVLADGSASSLMCANTVDGVVVVMSIDNEHSYHGINPNWNPGAGAVTCSFDFLGTETAISPRNTVPMQVAQQVVTAYFEGGFPRALRVAPWEPDWSGAEPTAADVDVVPVG